MLSVGVGIYYKKLSLMFMIKDFDLIICVLIKLLCMLEAEFKILLL